MRSESTQEKKKQIMVKNKELKDQEKENEVENVEASFMMNQD